MRENVVHRKNEAEIAALRFSEQLAGKIEFVVFDERFADGQALRFEECVSHCAADEHRVSKLHQILHHFDFVRNLCSAQHGNERAARRGDCGAQILELFFHQEAGGGLFHEFRDAHDGCMRAMGGAESIANENLIAERGEFFRELLIVGFFLGMVADIFKQQNIAILERIAFCKRFRTDAIGGKIHRLAEEFAQLCGHRRETIFRIDFPFRSAEMRSENDASAFSAARRMVGRVSRMRVSSVTLLLSFLSSGTLKSTRMKTRLPFISRSRMDNLFMVSVPASALDRLPARL